MDPVSKYGCLATISMMETEEAEQPFHAKFNVSFGKVNLHGEGIPVAAGFENVINHVGINT